MLSKFGLDYSRLMSDAYKVCVSLFNLVLIIIDAIVSETGDDDATAAFGLLAVRYLVDALEDPNLGFGPKRVQATTPVSVNTIPSSDVVFPKSNGSACINADLRLVIVNRLWQTMRTIFPQVPLVPAAEALLASLIKNEVSLLPEDASMDGVFESDSGESTRNKWVSLCVSVLSICDVSVVRAFWGYEEGSTMSGFEDKGFKWTQDLKNAVWRTTVEQWRDGEGHWEGAAVLLGVPFTYVLFYIALMSCVDLNFLSQAIGIHGILVVVMILYGKTSSPTRPTRLLIMA
jgi:hypothetical protein